MKIASVIYLTISFHSVSVSPTFDLKKLTFPPEHLRYFLFSHPDLAEQCSQDKACAKKAGLKSAEIRSCWGYEKGCERENAYEVQPTCRGEHPDKTKTKQLEDFYTQADFGYVKKILDGMIVMCEPKHHRDSSLECSQYLNFCRGRNLMLNFTGLIGRGNKLRYDTNILSHGQIGGYCRFHANRLEKEKAFTGALTSWAPEIGHFVQTPKRIRRGSEECEVFIQKPTYIIKLDSTYNMYHHFCDFFNLYASLHVNYTDPGSFTRDNNILIWETFDHESAFQDTWRAFTENPVWDLKLFRGKTVCFKNAVFPLLPRMVHGLYYSTPLVKGCERSGLFDAFSKHILHSLNIKKEKRSNRKVRITLLSRETSHRVILNEKELLSALREVSGYEVTRVVYNWNTMRFPDQLRHTHNTDVFIGMHGAGLTHLLFLPEWATVFELFNCYDAGCYSDLARLKGVNYITWKDMSKVVPEKKEKEEDVEKEAKFTNYWFDKDEFLRLVAEAAKHVRQHAKFRQFTKNVLNKDEL